MSNPIDKAFENETPTRSEPNNPGPNVKAIALKFFLLIFASY